jgi:hypothetical protein
MDCVLRLPSTRGREASTEMEPARVSDSRDVFLSYRSSDRDQVEGFASALRESGLSVFLDRHSLVAGSSWSLALEQALGSARAVLVFQGPATGLSYFQRLEAELAIRLQSEAKDRGEVFPVIPVLLPGARPESSFLWSNHAIDLREPGQELLAVQALHRALVQTDDESVEHTGAIAICPYRALEAFREEDAALFFGRDAVASELVARVEDHDIVAVIGASGSGKSSVVHAGLIPRLRRLRAPQRAWDVVSMRPGADPFDALGCALQPVLEPIIEEDQSISRGHSLGAQLAQAEQSLVSAVERVLARSNHGRRLLLVVDQFEELFTQTRSDVARSFVDALFDALARTPLSIAITLRADFYAQAIALDRRLSERLPKRTVNLSALDRRELRAVVEGPANRVGLRFEAGLVERILDQVERQPGALPLLEFALSTLWDKRERREIRHVHYDAIGEVAGAISRRAERVLRGAESSDHVAAANLFLRLVRVSESEEAHSDARVRVRIGALSAAERAVMARFIDARLIVLRSGEVEPASIELAHEALLRSWPQLARWIDAQRVFLLWRQALVHQVNEWQSHARDASLLLRGSVLRTARRWLRERPDALNSEERALIDASRRQQRRSRILQLTVASVLLLLPAAWTISWVVEQTNWFQVWKAPHIATGLMGAAGPEIAANWVYTLDCVGRLDAVGGSKAVVVDPFLLEWSDVTDALWQVAGVLQAAGRNSEAAGFTERALSAQSHLERRGDGGWQLGAAERLHRVGRSQAGRAYALRGLSLMRSQSLRDARAFGLVTAARTLAVVGLHDAARAALAEGSALPWPETSAVQRGYFAVQQAAAWVGIGEVDRALDALGEQPPTLAMIQDLLDGEHWLEAERLSARAGDPRALAIVASALWLRGEVAKAKALTDACMQAFEDKVNLARTREQILSIEQIENTRMYLQRHLLLEIMQVDEALQLLRRRDALDELATFATVLSDTGHLSAAQLLANELVVRIASAPPANGDWLRWKLANALSEHNPEQALELARAVSGSAIQLYALSDAAFGFAARGAEARAVGLINEIVLRLPTIDDGNWREQIWLGKARALIRLHRYHDAMGSDELSPESPRSAALLSAWTLLLRDDAVRRNPKLKERFERGPTRGMGRYGLYWL